MLTFMLLSSAISSDIVQKTFLPNITPIFGIDTNKNSLITKGMLFFLVLLLVDISLVLFYYYMARKHMQSETDKLGSVRLLSVNSD